MFLDRHLVIRGFTPAVSRIVDILPNDEGRARTDLASRLALPSLEEDVAAVFTSGQSIERRIEHDGGAAHLLGRQILDRDAGGAIEGVVVSCVDVTDLTAATAHRGS